MSRAPVHIARHLLRMPGEIIVHMDAGRAVVVCVVIGCGIHQGEVDSGAPAADSPSAPCCINGVWPPRRCR
jgi:hypothetical protein